MSEYEAYDLLMSLSSNSFQLMFGYFSIVSAFLVINFYALNVDLDNLYIEMITKQEQGIYELAWFGANPTWVPQSLTMLQTLIGLGGYICSVAFFYFQRGDGAMELSEN